MVLSCPGLRCPSQQPQPPYGLGGMAGVLQLHLRAHPGLNYLQHFMGALDMRLAVSSISITPDSTLFILKNVKLLQVD